MALNLLPTAEIKPSVSFFDSRKSTIQLLPRPPGGIRLKRRGIGAAGRRIILCSAQQSPPPAWPGSAFPEAGRKTWDGPKPISIVGSTGSIGTQETPKTGHCSTKVVDFPYHNSKYIDSRFSSTRPNH